MTPADTSTDGPAGSAGDSGLPRVLARSAARTVLLRRRPDGDGLEVVKRYERGSIDDARREVELGRLAALPGVVAIHGLASCPLSGRPEVRQAVVAGIDLATLLRREGPPAPVEALRWCASLAATLAALHGLHRPEAPNGLVHGDVKPSNVVVERQPTTATVTLIDLEHAHLVGTATAGKGFTGGTHGYAPPAAYDGVAPRPGFDVFGLGCVLFELLTGCRAGFPTDAGDRPARLDLLPLDPLPTAWADLVRACLGEECSAAEVADACREFAADHDTAQLADLVAWQSGDAAAAERLAGAAPDTVARRLRRRGRALTRSANAFGPAWTLSPESHLGDSRADSGDGPPAEASFEAGRLARRVRRLQRRLDWCPRHEGLRAARREALSRFDRLLRSAPAAVSAELEQGHTARARQLLDTLDDLLRQLGPPPLSATPADFAPHVIDRDPLTLLSASRQEVEREQREIGRWQQRFADAVASLDPTLAEQVASDCAEAHGGSRKWVAELRDRALRFSFYLERVGQRARLVDDLNGLAVSLEIDRPLPALVDVARRLRDANPPLEDNIEVEPRTRPLLGALRDVLRDFPELCGVVNPAVRELETFCEAITDRAWEIATDAESMLTTPPIPIRLLETELGRLDALLLADVIVDRAAQRPRLALVDAVETLRARIEEARAARDRIARGAQQAMDRGHLTTAIFDMERAVDRYDLSTADDEPLGSDLARQFEEAKRRKAEVEDALRENHRLAAKIAELLADPGAATDDRLDALHDHEQLLGYLCRALPADRRGGYEDDLRAVHAAQLRETGAAAEQRYAAEADSDRRVALARETLELLRQLAISADDVAETSTGPGPAVHDLLSTWKQRSVAPLPSPTQEGEAAAHRPPGLGHRLRRWLGGRRGRRLDLTALEATLADPEPLRANDSRLQFDAAQVAARLRAFVDLLDGSRDGLAGECRQLLVVCGLDESPAVATGTLAWEFVSAAAHQHASATGALEDPALRRLAERFRDRAVRAAFVVRVGSGDPSTPVTVLRDDPALRRALSVEDADLLAKLLQQR